MDLNARHGQPIADWGGQSVANLGSFNGNFNGGINNVNNNIGSGNGNFNGI
jgi:hypothetical protein